MQNIIRLPALALVAVLSLTACKSSEEKAEDYYQSGLALLAKGDEDRAMVEFRNVFNLNGFHKDARKAYADLLLKRGTLGEAVGQYLRLIEQYPDDGEVRRNLAELAIMRSDWNEAERHGREAVRLLPDDPSAKAVGLMLDFRNAVLSEDTATQDRLLTAARAALTDPVTQAEKVQPGLPGAAQLLRRMLIGAAMDRGDIANEMPLIDDSLKATPDDFSLNALRLQVLDKAGDKAGVEAQLRSMIEKFPDNEDLRKSLIAWLMSQKDYAGAERFLREQAGPETGPTDGFVTLIQFLSTTQGVDAARAETEKLLAANAGTDNADVYGSLLAQFDFDAGKHGEALTRLEAILAKAKPSDQTRSLRIMQARLLVADGDQVGARAQIETVLKEDPSNVDALKMRAAWSIQGDDPGAAIVDLRKALDQAPRDSSILTLMAEAHERDGAKDLAGERLSMAVEVSNRGVPESLRYADFLQREGRNEAALAVLNDALHAHEDSVPLLQGLAKMYLAASNWTKAEEMAGDLEKISDPAAAQAAKEVHAAALLGQGKLNEGMSFLSDMTNDANLAAGGSAAADDRRAIALLVETMTRNGQLGEARSYLDGQIAKAPDDPFLTLLSAGLDTAAGKADAAESTLKALLAKQPGAEPAVRMLYALMRSQHRDDEAQAVLDAGLKAAPEAPQLLMLKAGQQEQQGDIDGAIATYQQLYTRDSSDIVLANNLASLLASYHTDDDSLARAYAVARRLRGTTVPAFADTYGWIASRRGEYEEALPYLEAAVAGLPSDPVAHMHLGMTYAALGRTDDAKRLLADAIRIAGPDSHLAPIAEAQAKLKELGG